MNKKKIKKKMKCDISEYSYKNLIFGMSYETACQILGGFGHLSSKENDTLIYRWPNSRSEYYIQATFKNNLLIKKEASINRDSGPGISGKNYSFSSKKNVNIVEKRFESTDQIIRDQLRDKPKWI